MQKESRSIMAHPPVAAVPACYGDPERVARFHPQKLWITLCKSRLKTGHGLR